MTAHRFIARRTAAASALALLAACTTVGPDYKVPDKAIIKRPDASRPFMGAQEAPYKSEPLPADWWRLYRDPTLDALIAKAFANNTDLRVAAANLQRSHAVLEEAEELKRPEVEMSANPFFGRIAGMEVGHEEVLPDTGIYKMEAKISYQLDMWGRIKRAIEAAESDTESVQAASDLTHVMVAADTARAYAEACSAGYQLKVARESVDVQDKFAKVTADWVARGRGIALDNSRARSQLEALRAALPPLEARRRTALYKLAVLTGEVPGKFPAEVAKCETPPRVAAAVPVGDGAALLRRRPDIRQAERQLHAATARIGVAVSELYPNIELGASIGGIGFIPEFGKANTWHYGLGPLIQWNLPALSEARVHIAQAKASTTGALARFDGVVLNALRETESALTVYARELDRNAALRASRDQSALASQQAGKLYRYGRVNFLNALDAERSLAAAESAVAASSAKLADDQVTLFLALGGGWESSHARQAHGEQHAKHEEHAKE